MNGNIWERVIEKMKMNSNPTKMIKKVQALYESTSAKFMKVQLDKKQDLNQIIKRIKQNIDSDLKISIRQHRSGYHNLINVIKDELMASVKELRPDYMEQYDPAQNTTVFVRLQSLYRISVIRNYFKANAKGHDLHVFTYGDGENGFLQDLWTLFAQKLNIEWTIRNTNVCHILADEITHLHQY